MPSLLERFTAKVSPEALTGCWLWVGAVDQHGYGRISYGKTPAGNGLSAHATHVAWDLHVGTPRAGMDLLHTCDTPGCVAPHHLFLGTALDNVRDMYAKGRGKTGIYKTHCSRGHEMTPENTYFFKSNNSRHCLTCNAHRQREYRFKLQGKSK